jgi:hypothetical protein
VCIWIIDLCVCVCVCGFLDCMQRYPRFIHKGPNPSPRRLRHMPCIPDRHGRPSLSARHHDPPPRKNNNRQSGEVESILRPVLHRPHGRTDGRTKKNEETIHVPWRNRPGGSCYMAVGTTTPSRPCALLARGIGSVPPQEKAQQTKKRRSHA